MKNAKWCALALLSAFAASPTMAADLPVRPAPAPVMVAPAFSWSGFYLGINGGYSWGHSSRDLNFFNPLTGVTFATASGGGRDIDGGVFGGQIGYNWQSSNWVFGIEADAQWTGQKGSTTALCGACNLAGTTATLTDKLEWFGTIRGRVGFTVTPVALLYITGGGAYGSVKTDLALASTVAGVPVTVAGSTSSDRFGWTIGGGLEWGFAGNWSGKLEYLYMDLGSISNSVVFPTAAGLAVGANVTSNVTDHIFRAGINYRFGGRYY